MAAARSDSRMAVVLELQNGFEVPIPLAFFKRVSRPKPASFRTLDPVHKRPCRKPYVDIDGKEVSTADTLKGVEGPGGVLVPLGAKSLEMIERSTRTEACTITSFAHEDTVPLELALESFHARPDEKAPGAARSYVTFWSMLKGTGMCAVIEGWCPRAGSRPSILAIAATDDGLVAYAMPYAYEVKRAPTDIELELSEKAATLGQTVIESYDNGPFDFSMFEDTYMQRRQAAIDLALSGAEPPAELAAVPSDAGAAPDLLAALEGAVASQTDKPVKKTPKRARKAVQA